MKLINCIVIEDEPIARGILTEYISKVDYLKLIGEYENAIEALSIIGSQNIDLIFLDIHLPVIKGLEFLKSIKNPPSIIVTTAYHQYAVESFELNVVDYLLKPFAFERFLAAINKVDKYIPQMSESKESKFLFVSVQKRKVKIQLESIIYVESSKEYVNIFTESGVIKTKMSLTKLYEILSKEGFARPQRSFVVSLSKVKSYDQNNVEIEDKYIPIGKIFRENFIQKIKTY